MKHIITILLIFFCISLSAQNKLKLLSQTPNKLAEFEQYLYDASGKVQLGTFKKDWQNGNTYIKYNNQDSIIIATPIDLGDHSQYLVAQSKQRIIKLNSRGMCIAVSTSTELLNEKGIVIKDFKTVYFNSTKFYENNNFITVEADINEKMGMMGLIYGEYRISKYDLNGNRIWSIKDSTRSTDFNINDRLTISSNEKYFAYNRGNIVNVYDENASLIYQTPELGIIHSVHFLPNNQLLLATDNPIILNFKAKNAIKKSEVSISNYYPNMCTLNNGKYLALIRHDEIDEKKGKSKNTLCLIDLNTKQIVDAFDLGYKQIYIGCLTSINDQQIRLLADNQEHIFEIKQ